MGKFLKYSLYSAIAYFSFIAGANAESMECINTNPPASRGVDITLKGAWKNMITHCTIQQVDEYERINARLPSDDRILLFIDNCINRKCQVLKKYKNE